MPTPSLELVMFDLDGTVVDTLGPTFRCFQEAVSPVLGRTPSSEEILDRLGPADHKIVSDWVGPDEAPEAVQRLYACYEREFGRIDAFPGMIPLLEELRDRGTRIALFTGRGRQSTDQVLELIGIESLFEMTVAGDEVDESKPAPDGILKILEELGVAPSRSAYVGDTLMDVHAAWGAGVLPVAVLWRSMQPEVLKESGALAASDVASLRVLLLGESRAGE